jgi:hypothetical protein
MIAPLASESAFACRTEYPDKARRKRANFRLIRQAPVGRLADAVNRKSSLHSVVAQVDGPR